MANGTAVACDGKAVLILGAPGTGKSDLALRLIDRGARLIADDLVELTRDGDRIMAAFPGDAPPDLKGRIEARGIGIVAVPAVDSSVELALVVQATAPEQVPRMPETEYSQWLGIDVPCLHLALPEAATPTKVRLALGAISGSIIRPS
ncbi:MAG TPA: HPr kinase/phosphatase C-terminal domain-containing protein [Dongiaceae bacterium]|nr:HPr kinase/phosphatase C-terminal domain-containing protein [Dongiaceae bacterium]